VALRGSGDRIQTLGELLDQVNARVPLVIELKSHWDGSLALARRTAEVVADYDGPLALMSFDPDVVAGLAELAPRVPRGIVAERESVMEVRLALHGAWSFAISVMSTGAGRISCRIMPTACRTGRRAPSGKPGCR
jgi:glycerophosphoryl diester phosphodiesterase